jgi:hypothetical protein
LVPNEELESLNAKMHVSRGGQLTPYGDPHGVLAETQAGLDQIVRERAYLLWERGVGRTAAPTNSGIKRSTSASASAPTRYGSARAVREARRTSTGFGRAPLRRADTVARRAQRDSSLVSVEQRSRQRLSMSSGGSRRRKRPLRPSRITRLRLRLAVPHRFESLAVTIPPRWQLANTHGQRSLSGSTECTNWKKKEQASSC